MLEYVRGREVREVSGQAAAQRLARYEPFGPNDELVQVEGLGKVIVSAFAQTTDSFVAECRGLDLDVVGLMAIPPVDEEPSLHFALLAKIAERNGLAQLSMGMSADYDVAIQFGATHVRVGSALFGARPPKPRPEPGLVLIGGMRRIAWIASYPKSGNTWVRAIVDRILHPDTPFDINRLGDAAPSFNNIVQRFVDEQKIRLSASAPGEVRRYWTPVQKQICESADGPVFLKTHNVAAKFDSGPFPDPTCTTSAIYVLRDPRDVALSWAYHYKTSLGIAVMALCTSSAHNVKQEALGKTELLMSWGEHVYGWTSLKRRKVLVLRYEDLLADTGGGVRQIGAFLNSPLSDERVDAIVGTTAFGQLKQQERERGFRESVRTEGFFRAGTAGQWRNVQDQQVFQPIIEKHRREMRRHGYL